MCEALEAVRFTANAALEGRIINHRHFWVNINYHCQHLCLVELL